MTPEKIRDVMNSATLLHDAKAIFAAIDKLAQEMTPVLEATNPILLTVMNGGMMVASELAKRLNFPMQMDYVHATRYRGETRGGDSVHWKHQPSSLLEGRTVVIVDDILDGGLTLSAIIDYCQVKKAAKVYTAVLCDKVNCRESGAIAKADFTGIELEDYYVFGFGLDYHDYLRNIEGIYAVAKEHM